MTEDYKCPFCGGAMLVDRKILVNKVDGDQWSGTVYLRCINCDRSFEDEVSLKVLPNERAEM